MSTTSKVWASLIERIDKCSLNYTIKISGPEVEAILAIDTRLKHIECKLEELLDLVAPDV
tara:strand:- start:42050 stop:42229 length:180 start_codon:yes stop_codon:yes gene_type:complete